MSALVAVCSAVTAGVFAAALISGVAITDSAPQEAPSVAEVAAHLHGGAAATEVRARLQTAAGVGSWAESGCTVLR